MSAQTKIWILDNRLNFHLRLRSEHGFITYGLLCCDFFQSFWYAYRIFLSSGRGEILLGCQKINPELLGSGQDFSILECWLYVAFSCTRVWCQHHFEFFFLCIFEFRKTKIVLSWNVADLSDKNNEPLSLQEEDFLIWN